MELESRIPGFHRLPFEERISVVATRVGLDAEERRLLEAMSAPGQRAYPMERFDRLVENAVGGIGLPLGIATNFRVDGRDRLVPMAIEEPSVVAAASHAAKIARAAGGFTTELHESLMVGQVHLVGVDDLEAAQTDIAKHLDDIIAAAEPEESSLADKGGGVKDIETRTLQTRAGPVLVVHLLIDTRDAMGANAVNTRVERVAPLLEEITRGKARLRILSNFADRRLVTARAIFPAHDLGGPHVVDAILEAQAIAEADPYRAATHNKGVMNGVDAVVVATGNDWRALEAGAHAYAAKTGRYAPLTTYAKKDGDLEGALTLPVSVGTVGGATKANPVAALSLKILQVAHAPDLARIIAAVGLAQNLAALRALTTEGIQEGHMRLHRRLATRS